MTWWKPPPNQSRAKRSLLQVRALVLDFLYPPVCAGCGKLGYAICSGCRAAIIPIAGGDCRICNRPLEFGDICGACSAGAQPLGRVYAATVYSGPIREAVLRLKYENCRYLAGPLAGILARRLVREELGSPLMVPVPLHRKRIGERGYNQSELLAKELARALNLEVELRGLARVVDTRPQVGLKEGERLDNVKNAFRGDPSLLGGRDVLLVDDISTTGATLAACARACRRAGAVAVRAAVVGRG